ncbi:hypothetical protein F4808DRAFT_466294 [Astrocystis sublimbata]|nr:hypothetical protein F4808DRAFT_466429 [Astrocystis sublimbata]KAI0187932.1 hypothetical protein F4808DRAFT_466293 [Astrocystis sublimbata]KAI0187933.1 hypothetical protein F4808DRAFT_466294 [Astrocystis sublimbata]
MAPAPDERPHYSGASPLDGGGDPTSLGGNDAKLSPSGLEIGLIVGILSLAIVSLIWLFFWRSRRNRARQTQAISAAADPDRDQELTETAHPRIPTPISKDDRISTGDKDEATSVDPPTCSSRLHLPLYWPHTSASKEPPKEPDVKGY